MTTKLATIVAIDVAGFSALAEANEDAAIAAVGRLDARAAKCAREHGGRVFNTAGDSVMMEFASVAHAIEAAAELAANPDPPIRVGVHLGEVSEMANGDLLGHGVNVAARLQQLAKPGTVVVSEDTRRALRGALADRLVDKGVVKLDKIDESIGIYELTAQPSDAVPADIAHRKARAARWIAIGSVAVLVGVLALWLAWPQLAPRPPARVAVFSLTAPQDDPALQQLAQGVSEDVAGALSSINVQTVARAETAVGTREHRLERARDLDAAFVFDGAVERAGANIRLSVAVVRVSDRVTLWSSAFQMRAQQIAGLRARAAEKSADVLACGVNALRGHRLEIDSEVLSLFLRACENTRDDPLETRDALKQVVDREPRFTLARARLALSSVVASEAAPDPLRTSLRDSARAEAQRALREDRGIGESYLALEMLEPPRNWADRENLLRQALARDELNGSVNTFYADLLREVGRISEALAYSRRGMALDPLSGTKRRNVALLLSLSGEDEAAESMLDEMTLAWPDHPALWRARLRAAIWSGRFDDAASLLDAPAPGALSSASRSCWRQVIQARRRTGLSLPERTRECIVADLPQDQAVMLLTASGDIDGAFALMGTDPTADALFASAAAPLRADPRFMPLMRDVGLLRYWNLSGHWPDFCADPALPYDCRAEAARLR